MDEKTRHAHRKGVPFHQRSEQEDLCYWWGPSWDVTLKEGIVEEYTPEGWPFPVSVQGKLATTWGKMKQGR